MTVNFKIDNHIIMPFGCPKWDINQIQITGVSTDGTYFASKTKCAHIIKTEKRALRLQDFRSFFPNGGTNFPVVDTAFDALQFIFTYLKENCELQTEYEKRFLDIYQKWLVSKVEHSIRYIYALYL